MSLITVKKTQYGHKIETASRTMPTEQQLKRVNKYLQHQNTKITREGIN